MTVASSKSTDGSKNITERASVSVPNPASKAVSDPTPTENKTSNFGTMVPKQAREASQAPDHLKLLAEALQAAADADTRDKRENERRAKEKLRSTAAGREVVRSMLVFIESFMTGDRKLNESSLSAFLEENTKKVKSSTGTKYYRLSKHCSVAETPSSMILKRAYALEAIIIRKIHSDDLMDEFEEEESVGPNGDMKKGLQKYVLMYDDYFSCTTTVNVSRNKYKALSKQKLLEEAQDFLDALIEVGAPRKTIDALKGFVREKTQVTPQAEAA